MNIERIEAHDFRSWHELDLRVERGVTLIQGPNGAGKSSILDAVWFCLFGATSDAGRLIRRGTDQATVEVRVRTEAGLLFVERSIRRSARSATVKLDVLIQLDGEELTTSITGATTTETQALLERLLGVSRETLMASAFSAQGDGASFCEAKPADRKRILGDVLGLGLWSGLHERARAEALDAKRSADAARGALALVDGASARLDDALDTADRAKATLAARYSDEMLAEMESLRLAEEAEQAREARRQHQAAVESAERARVDHQRATAERAAADEALARAKDAAANAPSVDDANTVLSNAMDVLGEAQEADEFALKEQRHYREQLAEAGRQAAAAEATFTRANEDAEDLHVRWVTAKEGACAECGQPLLSDEAKATVERLKDAYAAATQQETAANEDLTAWRTRLDYLRANAIDDATVDAKANALRIAREAAQAAQTRLAEAETIQSLAGSIDAAQQRARDAMDREGDTAEALRKAESRTTLTIITDGVEEKHAHALTVLEQARTAHRTAAAELATAEAAAQQAERDAAAETTARERVADAERTETDRALMAAGFSPNGVPALILENSALPALEAEANRVLGELNAPVRIELRSQKVLRSRDDVADTLDIVVLMDAMEAPYETLSGGERTRVALALRAALTRLLASKRGARVRLLVVDEPAGLDSAGCEQLAQVLEEFVQAGVFETIILVTHQAELADQIARVIRVERAAGGDSRLATRVAATAPMQEAVDA